MLLSQAISDFPLIYGCRRSVPNNFVHVKYLLLKPQKENRSQNSVATMRKIERGYFLSLLGPSSAEVRLDLWPSTYDIFFLEFLHLSEVRVKHLKTNENTNGFRRNLF